MKKIIEIDRCTSCPYFNRLVGKDYKLVLFVSEEQKQPL